MRRLVGVVAVLVAAAAIPAAADVIYEESAQLEFGLTSGGQVVGRPAEQIYEDAWKTFAGSVEGARILSKIESRRDIEVRIEVVDEIIHEGEPAYGLTIKTGGQNDEGQDEYVIRISRDHKESAEGLAETLYHEFRHVELFADGDDNEGHEILHADADPRMDAFRDQIEFSPPSAIRTPIYDEMEANAEAWRRLRADSIRLANELGDLVDIDMDGPPEFTGGEIEIVDLVAVESHVSDALVEATEAAEPVDSDGRCRREAEPGALVCGASSGALDDVDRPYHFVSMELAAPVPMADFDGELEYVLAVDSDGEASNNHAGRSRFAQDPAAGTDRWLMLSFDPQIESWRFQVWQVGDGGSGVNIDRDAEEIVVIEGSTVTYGLPPIGYSDLRFRAFSVTHDGSYGGATGMDVWGALPTDPPIGLDGTRFGGTPTATASNEAGDVIFYFGPTAVVSGDELVAEFCMESSEGAPPVQIPEVAATLGEPPSGETATHDRGSLDTAGCTRMLLPVLEPPGTSSLYFFDGAEVVPISPIIVVRPSLVESSSP